MWQELQPHLQEASSKPQTRMYVFYVLQILGGQLPPPPQAQPLYDALNQMSAGRAGMAGQPAY